MASSEEYASWIVANKEKRGTPEFDKVSQAYQLSRNTTPASQEVKIESKPDPDVSDQIMANPVTKFARGAAAPFMGLNQVILNAVSPERGKAFQEEYIDRPAAMEKRGEEGNSLVDNLVGGAAKLAGNVLSPIPLAAGKALPAAKTAFERIKQGILMGGGMAATAPVENAGDDYAEKKIADTGLGLAAGGVLPAGWEIAKLFGRGARNLAQPFLGGESLNKAAGRVANIVSGEKNDSVISALEKSKDIVPGSKLTAGQAATSANSAEFSALQDISSGVKPSLYYGPSGRQGEQEAARLSQIQQISGGADDTKLNAAKAIRTAVTGPLYASVEKSKAKVDARDVLSMVDGYLKKSSNEKAIQIPLDDIRKKLIASTKGKLINIENNPQALASLSKEIKAKMGAKTANGQPEYDVKVLTEIKKTLDDAIGKAEPAYKEARNLFKEKSIPINQMQVGKELEARLLNPSGKETSGSYLKSIDDSFRVLKDATGYSRYKDLSQVLKEKTPLATGVGKDLENDLVYKDLAQKGATAARGKIGEAEDSYKGVGILSTPVVIFNAIVNRLEGKTGKLSSDKLAETMRDPKEMARIMKAAKPFERQALVDAFMKHQGTAAGSMVAGER